MKKRPRHAGGRGLWLRTACLCATALLAGCSDDYKWDDSDPDFLNTSIYEYLTEHGDYTNFVRIIDDLGYTDVLKKTGSKTLFVANDEAFDAFYADNSWGVGSYEELTVSQKKLLLGSAMVNNAYLLEMMSSTTGPVAGQCLRRETALTVLDSVPLLEADELPLTYNASDKDYWSRFRQPDRKGIRIALDNTAPMMTHFLPAQMANKGITDADFSIVTGKEREANDAYIFDSKVMEQDITCQNGYVNRLDKVLVTPQNMAEVLRTNGRTRLFSHMMDRFSAPFYSETLTQQYRQLYADEVDSVWEKRYFNTQTYRPLTNDQGTDPIANPNGTDVAFGLSFDPGWNAYQPSSQIEKEQDMGVIFAPTDERLYDYFFAADGGGRFLLEAYAAKEMEAVEGSADYSHIYAALDQIPLSVIQALLNNLMKDQFCNTVPSKFETIKDDAQDPMLDASDIEKIADVLLCNNGAIYLMDEVITPAQYAAVSAPAYVSQDMRVMNYAIQRLKVNGESKNFYAYLLAMSSRFSLLVPRDGFWYVDPASFALSSGKQRAIYFEWDETSDAVKGTSYALTYDFSAGTYTIDTSAPLSTGAATTNELNDRLNDILETHTIVHSDNSATTGIDETATGVECDQHFFISKNGAPIYVDAATQRDRGMSVSGGWALQHGEKANVVRFDDKTSQTNGNGNGMAYELDAPVVPTIESVYSQLYNHRDQFGDFFELCLTDNDEILTELESYLNRDEDGDAIYSTTSEYLNRYTVFVNNGGLPCYDSETGSQVTSATNVRFFNNYRYTVYVPTNHAVQQAIERGLPTWESIREFMELDLDPEERTPLTEEEEEARNVKAAAMVTVLINYIRYHFQDNSVFADQPVLAETAYESATLNSETGIYQKLTVSSRGNGSLTVKDAAGNSCDILDNFKNQLARDYVLQGTSSAPLISASSFAVLHGIDGVLSYKALTGGRFDSDWSSVNAARRLLNKFRITK